MQYLFNMLCVILLACLTNFVLSDPKLAYGQTQKKLPEWISTPVFKKGGYIYFVGMGMNKDIVKAREEAMDNIKISLLETILAEITSEAKKEFLYISDDKSSEVMEKIEQDIVVKSKARIYIPVPEEEVSTQGKDGNYTVYLLVKYPESKILEERQRLEQIYKDTIMSVDKFIEEGDRFVSEGKLVNAIVSYAFAARNSLNVEERKMLYPEIIKKIEDILSRISIEIVEGNGKKVGVGESGSIKFRVFYNFEGNKVPVRDANISFKVVSGGAEINPSATSDKDGFVSCDVSRVVKFEDKKLCIRAFLNLDFSPLSTISQESKRDASKLSIKARLVKSEATWFMSASKAKNAVIIVLNEKHNSYTHNSKLSSALASYVMRKGYKISKVSFTSVSSDSYDEVKKFLPKDSVLVLVKVSEPQEKEIDFHSEKIRRVEVNVDVEIYDEEGNIINSFSHKLSSSSLSMMNSNLPKNIGEKLEEIEF
ncbi:MAG: hypothetical protein ABDH28_02040 [Brevinematia bacterium]